MTFTVSSETLIWTTAILGLVGIAYFFVRDKDLPHVWLVCVVGIALAIPSFRSLSNTRERCRQEVHQKEFDELPSEWKVFYEGLNKIDAQRLQKEAIRRFVQTGPPPITIENRSALIGAELKWCTQAMKTLRDSIYIDEMVILDFAEGKNGS